jgi:hypothetical protein
MGFEFSNEETLEGRFQIAVHRGWSQEIRADLSSAAHHLYSVSTPRLWARRIAMASCRTVDETVSRTAGEYRNILLFGYEQSATITSPVAPKNSSQ